MQNNLIIISLLSALLFIAGCEPHRIDIQQGNRITPENFAKLKTGMTRNQVLFILGSPLLKDEFHSERWDYIYYLKPGNNPVRKSRVTLFFDGDELAKIDDSAFTPEAYDTKSMVDESMGDQSDGGGGAGGGGGGGGGHTH